MSSEKDTKEQIATVPGNRAVSRWELPRRVAEHVDDKYRLLFEKSMDPTVLLDRDVLIDCNDAALQLLHCSSKDQVLGIRMFDECPDSQPDGRLSSEKAQEMIGKALEEGANRFEWVRQDSRGMNLWTEVSLTAIPIDGRQVLLAVWRDIGERKKREAGLQESEERHRVAVQHSNDAVFVIRGGTHLYANERFLQMFGYDRSEDVIGKELELFIHPDDLETIREYGSRRQAGEQVPSRYEFKGMRRDGGTILGEVSVTRIMYEGEPASLGYIRDITERKKAEDALRTSRFQLAEAMELASIVYWERDPTTECFIFNDPFYAFYGTSAELEGGYLMAGEEYVKRFLHPDDVPVFRESIEKRRQHRGREFVNDLEHRIVRRDGEVRHVLARIRAIKDEAGRTVRCYGANQNITERKRLEEKQFNLELQLRESQKMESIGTLAGGIAHDFNNMLAVIIGNAEIASEDTDEAATRANLNQILIASRRSRDLVKQILAFSRRTSGQGKPLRMGPLLEETYALLRASLPSTIRMTLDIRTRADTILADASQIQQVIINLANNAARAMPDGGGLNMALSSTTAASDSLTDNAVRDGYVKLTIKDSGTGIPPEVQKRMFEPFFTTREAGQGTGMGLAVVYGIVKGYNGRVEVESAPGKGSTFAVLFPRSNSFVSSEEKKEEDVVFPSRKARVLAIDDEPTVVRMTKALLEKLGCRVTAYTDPCEALKAFADHPDSFDIILTDQTMPGMTGILLAKRVFAMRRDIPIILCTGYSEAVSAEKAKETGIREFVMKPLTKNEMAQAIRRVLEEGAGWSNGA